MDLNWYLSLRWLAIAGHLIGIAAARWGFHFALPMSALWAVLLAELAVSAGLEFARRRGSARPGLFLPPLMVVDAAFLTLLLYLTGGPENPFNFLYLVNIALGAVILRASQVWTLTAISLLLSGALFLDHHPLVREAAAGGAEEEGCDSCTADDGAPGAGSTRDAGLSVEHAHGSHDMDLHLRGMWVAFAVAAIFIVLFVGRIQQQLARREEELMQAREERERSQRMVSLATLAAGAAHELATPLGTIAVTTGELERSAAAMDDGGLREDVATIRGEVDRCRLILNRLSSAAGSPRGGTEVVCSVGDLVANALGDGGEARVHLDPDLAEVRVRLFAESWGQALRNIVDNARKAARSTVEVVVAREGERLIATVRDDGTGMRDEVRARAGEPFFTTRPAGTGMGLGLFVAFQAASSLGGGVVIDSREGAGTTVRFSIPWPGVGPGSPGGIE